MDVDITSGSGTSNNVAAGFITGQDLNHAAVAAELAQINDPTAVAAPSEPAGASETGAVSSAGASTGVAATSEATQPTAAGPTVDPPTSPAAPTSFGGGIGSGDSSQTQTTFAVQATSAQGEQSCINTMPTTTLTMTLAVVPGASTETFTQYASVTETVFHTIYPSGFDKRTRKLRKGLSPGTGQKANVEFIK
jgi:hypothetical protein